MNKQVIATTLFLSFATIAFGQQHHPEYAYVSTVVGTDAFSVDRGTGALNSLPGSPFAVTGRTLAADPAGHFLFAGGTGITVSIIDRPTGALAIVPGSPFAPTLGSVSCLAVNPSGRFLFAAALGSIYTFSIDGNRGALTQAGLPVSTQGCSFAVSPDGKFLYVGGLPPAPLEAFSIDERTGNLTSLPFTVAGTAPIISRDGKYLYAISSRDQASTNLYAYSVDANSGALLPVSGSPFLAPYTEEFLLAIDPTGRFLYECLLDSANSFGVAGFAINSTNGAVENSVPGSPFATIGYPVGIVIDSSGKFLYTADCCEYVASEFDLSQTTGSLSSVSGPALPIAFSTQSITLTAPKPVSTASLTSLAIFPADPSVNSSVTSAKQFTASGTYSDGTHRFLTASVTWGSSNPGVATISNMPGQSGLASVLGSGHTLIEATLNGVSAQTTLTVNPAAEVNSAFSPTLPPPG